MNSLERLHQKINSSNWSVKDWDTINAEYQALNGELDAQQQYDLLKLSEKEREALAFSKTVDGIKYMVAGTRTLQDGTVEPAEWPDINNWNEEDFQHIHNLFLNLTNTYVKVEFGLLLFFKNKLSPAECKILYDCLTELCDSLYVGILDSQEITYSAVYFYNYLPIALKIAYYKRKAPGFEGVFQSALAKIERIHKEWTRVGKYRLHNLANMSELVMQYKDSLPEPLPLVEFLDRNKQAIPTIEKEDTHKAIELINLCLLLSNTLQLDTIDLLKHKARLFEALANARKAGDLAIITFIETALRIYREIGSQEDVDRLEGEFNKVKREGEYGEVVTGVNGQEFNNLALMIQEEVDKSNEEQILETISQCVSAPKSRTV